MRESMDMRNLILSTVLLLSPGLAAAAAPPVYSGKPPQTYCFDAEKVDSQVQSCDGNRIFFEAARRCTDEFKRLKGKVTNDLRAKLSSGGSLQQKNFQDSQANAAEAMAAHAYLVAVGEKAVQELDDYFDFFEHPEDAETDEDVEAEPCFIEAASALNNLVNDLEEEVEAMKSAKGTEAVLTAISGTRKFNIGGSAVPGSVTTPAGGTGQGTATIPVNQGIRRSDISGTEDKKKKP